MNVTHLECALCGLHHEAHRLHNLCTACGKPLLVRYDLDRAKMTLTKESLASRRPDLWRYREVLPVEDDKNIVSLGEGWTPLLRATRLSRRVGIQDLFIKDESQNPTQSFKARGMAAAVSMAKELGAQKLAVPSAGNAAGALAAYAAKAGLEAFIFMPKDTPVANVIECEQTGAHVTLMDGLITDCGAEVGRRKEAEGWFDVSTLKEPYRIEGKKTMGYELAEQFDWQFPDVIIYPTGGGTGLIGMWKAFDEMQAMGWLKSSKKPKMISCQSEGCAPISPAFDKGERFATKFENAATIASGIRVPAAVGDFMILDAVRQSGGIALATAEAEIPTWIQPAASKEGIALCPETAVCLGAMEVLFKRGTIKPTDKILIFNTGASQKYPEAVNEQLARIDITKPIDWEKI